jgi:hypothetical protein
VKRALKIGVSVLLGLILVGAVLLYPYELPGIPEWRVQVLDSSGRAMASVPVSQEWLNPIDEGIVSADQRETDATGAVVFPKRPLHNRFALGFRTKRSARLNVCANGEYGDVDWDGDRPEPPKTLTLKNGSCPYD